MERENNLEIKLTGVRFEQIAPQLDRMLGKVLEKVGKESLENLNAERMELFQLAQDWSDNFSDPLERLRNLDKAMGYIKEKSKEIPFPKREDEDDSEYYEGEY